MFSKTKSTNCDPATAFCCSGVSGALYLLVLIGCDCGELRLREGEAVDAVGRQRLDLGEVHARVVMDDVNSWFVFMHRLEDNLHREG